MITHGTEKHKKVLFVRTYLLEFPHECDASNPNRRIVPPSTDARIAYTDNKTVALVGIAETLVLRWVSLPN